MLAAEGFALDNCLAYQHQVAGMAAEDSLWQPFLVANSLFPKQG